MVELKELKKQKMKELKDKFEDEISILNLQYDILKDAILESKSFNILNEFDISFNNEDICICDG